MRQIKLRAVFMRGGTSKAVMFRREDLPRDQALWAPIFLGVIGSPDPNGRQLDGMGGGVSSLSKVCVIGPPSRSDADVDYTFAQVSVKDASVDYSGNCGNMSSAVGPFAVDEGIVTAQRRSTAISCYRAWPEPVRRSGLIFSIRGEQAPGSCCLPAIRSMNSRL